MPKDPSPAASNQSYLQLENVSKRFADFVAVNNVSLSVERGEIFCLLGASGCGKTTLLRLLAGFEAPSSGRLLIDGQDLALIPPYRRPVNMMFQSYALFPHMDVEHNVSFGLEQEGLTKSDIRRRVSDILDIVKMSTFLKRKPHQLSGGQRQRVALARALVKRPKLLLLDEPLGALDRKLREHTQFELINIQQQLGVSFVVVTHDQEEAMTLATRIGVMNHGEIVQVGAPRQIYEFPQTRFVADFIGISNVMHGLVEPGQMIRTDDGVLPLPDSCAVQTGQPCALVVRPEKMFLCAADEAFVSGCIEESIYAGSETKLLVRLASGALITVRRQAGLPIGAIGERVFVRWDRQQARLLES